MADALPTEQKAQGAARAKWYADAPLCPECEVNPVSVGQARIGFFGLSLTYFDRCDECLPDEVAKYSRDLRASLLGVSE